MIPSAFVARYDTGTDDAIGDLREAVGADKMWAGKVPEHYNGITLTTPYIRVTYPATSLVEENKAGDWIEETTVQVDVFGSHPAEVDTILNLLEKAYVRQPLTITGATWISTHPSNRFWPEEGVPRGLLQFKVAHAKSV